MGLKGSPSPLPEAALMRGLFSFRIVTLHGTRSVADTQPPAMRVRIDGSALAQNAACRD